MLIYTLKETSRCMRIAWSVYDFGCMLGMEPGGHQEMKSNQDKHKLIPVVVAIQYEQDE